MRFASYALPLLAALGFANPAAAVNIVKNGGFETWSGGYSGNPSQLADATHSGTGYTALSYWTNTTYGFLMAPGQADTTGSRSPEYNNYFKVWGPGTGVNNGLPAASPKDGNYLALDGAASYRRTGIEQTITGLTIGADYNISFAWAGAQQSGFRGPTTEQVQVKFGTAVKTTAVWNNPDQGFSGWKNETFTFKAVSATQVLNFLAIGTPNNLPPTILLDGVTGELKSTAVPEPATLALFGAGLLGLAGLRRRRG